MKKEEIIKRYGVEAYEKRCQQSRDWYKAHHEARKKTMQEWGRNHPEVKREGSKQWRKNNPEKVIALNQETSRKGGKHYEQVLKQISTGIPYEKRLVRRKHAKHYSPYKQIIAPESVLHHEWLPETANFTGVALVEKAQHQHGYIDVIQILEGEITLFTEEEILKEGNR